MRFYKYNYIRTYVFMCMYMYVYICHINQNITQAKALPTKRKKNFICILFSPYPFSGKRVENKPN